MKRSLQKSEIRKTTGTKLYDKINRKQPTLLFKKQVEKLA